MELVAMSVSAKEEVRHATLKLKVRLLASNKLVALHVNALINLFFFCAVLSHSWASRVSFSAVSTFRTDGLHGVATSSHRNLDVSVMRVAAAVQ